MDKITSTSQSSLEHINDLITVSEIDIHVSLLQYEVKLFTEKVNDSEETLAEDSLVDTYLHQSLGFVKIDESNEDRIRDFLNERLETYEKRLKSINEDIKRLQETRENVMARISKREILNI